LIRFYWIYKKFMNINILMNQCIIEIQEVQEIHEPLSNIDKWNKWSGKSNDIPFKSTIKCVGNGEQKLAKELDIIETLGGQNNTIDLKHPILGNISVKDMTNDDCVLGVEGRQNLRYIFRKNVNPLLNWSEKYKDKCQYADSIFNELKKKYGKSKTNLFDGIDRLEISRKNFEELNKILENIKIDIHNIDSPSIKSDYITEICKNLEGSSLIEKCNECVRKEATNYTLIIVHKSNGWMIVRNLNKIICPRITKGAPRINVNL